MSSALASNRSARQPAPHAREFTMEDMKLKLESHETLITAIRGDTQLQAAALQRVENAFTQVGKDVSAILLHLGEEKEDGKGNYTGTGLLGRVRRVERGQKNLRDLYHRWIAFGSGFVACGGAMILAIWWLIGDKIAIVLKGTGHG